LILSKIIKIVSTRCHILRLKCTKFDFGKPRWGAYSAPPDPLAGFGGPTCKGRGGNGKEREGKKDGRGCEGGRGGKGGGKGKRREGKGLKPLQSNFSGYVAADP